MRNYKPICESLNVLPIDLRLWEIQLCWISVTLKRCRGNRTHTARLLGICKRTLQTYLGSLLAHRIHVEAYDNKTQIESFIKSKKFRGQK